MGQLLLGTSGWSYREWEGPFYESSKERKLARYAEIFPVAEINSTFYAYPSRGLVWGWVKNTPDEFVFTAKLPRLITHDKMLQVSEGAHMDLKSFVDVMQPLKAAGKLGCLLIQLPPSFDYRPEELGQFFEVLPEGFDFAIEFRNLSWLRGETWELLRDYSVAYTTVDEPLLPPTVHLTADFGYIRWHGRGQRPWFNYRYRSEELEPWVPKVEEVTSSTKKTFGFFNNHFHGFAVENGLQILEMLGQLSPAQRQAKKRIDEFMRKGPAAQQMITEFEADRGRKATEDMLTLLVDTGRLRRAAKIQDGQVEILFSSSREVEARVKRYVVKIDAKQRSITHDCDDWGKRIPQKLFCKHVARVFLTLPESLGSRLLEDVISQKDVWEFRHVSS
ncbi:MAG: DUF72 domain-containing protein [Candidatus Geothermarchaeales archaeon]